MWYYSGMLACAERQVPCLTIVGNLDKVFPSPARPLVVREEEGPSFGRSVLISGGLHLLAALLLFIASQSSPSAEPEVPIYDIDLSMVELTAFETELPKQRVGAPEPAPVAQPPQERPSPPTERPEISLKSKKVVQRKENRDVQEKNSSTTISDQLRPTASASRSGVVGEAVGGGDGVSGKARISYHDMVAVKLARAKRYPERALRKQITGAGVLKVKIAPVGEVMSVEIVESTQSPILDEELQRMVARAAPFPAFPPGLNDSNVVLVVPVSFRIEG